MSEFTDRLKAQAASNKDEIVGFFTTTPGLVVGSIIGLGIIAALIFTAIVY